MLEAFPADQALVMMLDHHHPIATSDGDRARANGSVGVNLANGPASTVDVGPGVDGVDQEVIHGIRVRRDPLNLVRDGSSAAILTRQPDFVLRR
jgi:hypothetical protein